MKNQFTSRFEIGALIRWSDETGKYWYGIVTAISFFKSDSVNFAAAYTIQKVNSQDVVNGLPENEIDRAYREA